MKTKYRVLSLVLSFVLCLGLLPAASAAGTDNQYRVIAGGVSHSLAVKADGSVWAWGSNSAKQVNPASKDQNVTKPSKVTGLDPAVSVAGGSDFSAALMYDGSVTVWGGGSGLSAVPGLTGVSSIAAGQSTLLALKRDGTVWQWTFGDPAPEQIKGLTHISAVSAGGGHYLALNRAGQVWAWGNNSRGQAGVAPSESWVNEPRRIAGLSDIVSIAAGYSHSLAVNFNGQVYAWGSNGSGQLGNNKTDDSSTPQNVLNVKNAVQVSSGNETSMALTADGKIYTWGYGEYGQLGAATSTNSRLKPETVSGNNFGAPVQIASGMNHNLLLNNRGAVYTWGRNRDSQLGTGKDTNGNTPQSIGLSLSDNSSYAIGSYSTDVQAGLSSWAKDDLAALYDTHMVPPSLWERYDQNITRAEFAHLIVAVYEHIKGISSSVSSRSSFKDVNDHELEQSILKSTQLQLFRGRSDTQFAPDEQMTRQETATLLCTLVNKLEGTRISTNVSSLSYYSDAAQIGTWAIPYVAFAHDNNIMLGTDGRFNPTGYTTREQALSIIARLVDRYGWAK